MKNTAIFLALLLVVTTIRAEVLELPAEVQFSGQPVELSFKVRNEAFQALPVQVDVQVVSFKVLRKPDLVQPGEVQEIRLQLQPRNDLLGSTYQSTITVKMGAQETRKEVKFVFGEAPKQAPKKNALPPATPKAPTAFAVLPLAFNEFMMNLGLALLAAILLISFIARLTKRFMQNRG
ncbi:MAG TPA: hypothetical protein HA252_05670 [Candidatus Diapherotrites archaeon]|uniref:Alpha-galactosidase NEW3 domain-containing protein n=1 Tax=Candidatus Iainarchaeum sp. TaxID=3101447 RepID=A0A7J4JKL6_9ARCH|nr:hypothetical protein [Candidatus Diapherotrites archaeon]HIH16865.1 hypothetical protein [Candidatus Diapherotrites archaeon]